MIIYKVTNNINGKVYIGQTKNTIEKRIKEHSTRGNLLFQAIKKYGIENFTIEEIDGANSLSELNYLEQHYIYTNNCIVPTGYNLRIGWNNSTFSLETKKKMSDSKKGIIPWNKGVKITEKFLSTLAEKRKRKDIFKGKHKKPRTTEHSMKLGMINYKPVSAFQLSTGIYLEFKSNTEASKYFNIHRSTVDKAVIKNHITLIGWKFERIENTDGK